MSHTTIAVERRPSTTSGTETLPEYVVPFSKLSLDDISRAGGKNASLGEMIKVLAPRGIRIPDGFALTADAFRLHLKEAGLDSVIYAELEHLDTEDVTALASTARSIRARIAGRTTAGTGSRRG